MFFLNAMGLKNLQGLCSLLGKALEEKQVLPREWTVPQFVEVARFCAAADSLQKFPSRLISRLKVSPYVVDPIILPSREVIFTTNQFGEKGRSAFVVEGPAADQIARKIFVSNYGKVVAQLNKKTVDIETMITRYEEALQKAEAAASKSGEEVEVVISISGEPNTKLTGEELKGHIRLGREKLRALKLVEGGKAVSWLNLAGLNDQNSYGAYVSEATWNLESLLDCIWENQICTKAIKEALQLLSVSKEEMMRNRVYQQNRTLAALQTVPADFLLNSSPEIFRLLFDALSCPLQFEQIKILFALLKQANPRWFDAAIKMLKDDPKTPEFQSAVRFLSHYEWISNKVAKRLEQGKISSQELEKIQALLGARVIVTKETLAMKLEKLVALRRSMADDLRHVSFPSKDDPRRILFFSVLKERVFCDSGPQSELALTLSDLVIEQISEKSSEDFFQNFSNDCFYADVNAWWNIFSTQLQVENRFHVLHRAAICFRDLAHLFERPATPQLLAFVLTHVKELNSRAVRYVFNKILGPLEESRMMVEKLFPFWKEWGKSSDEVRFISQMMDSSGDIKKLVPTKEQWLEPVLQKRRTAFERELTQWCQEPMAFEVAL